MAERAFDTRAKRIAVKLQKADDQVAEAAVMLAELRNGYIEAHGWERWPAFCAEHFPQWGERYIRKLIAIGCAEDPAAAMAEWRGASRERSQQARERARAAALEQEPPEVRTSSPEPEGEPEPGPARRPPEPKAEPWAVAWCIYLALPAAQRALFDARWREAHTPRTVAA